MKKILKNIVIVSVIICVLINLPIKTYCDNKILKEQLITISQYILKDTNSELQKYLNVNNITASMLEKDRLLNNKISVDGEIKECQIYITNYEYSSTKDTVAFIDIKIDNKKYNQLVMIEYHIDKNGKIYGHNIWTY